MPSDSGTSYDELPYSDSCFSLTHPDQLAVMAILHGLEPPGVDRCRVLELGCALGGNLIPMAQGLPEAEFVGIDLSQRQIDAAKDTASALGLRNIDLRAMSIADIGPEFGRFDYVICHGVYSWVPGPIQDKILSICAESLSPGGVAYVSFNTYPGWHARGLARDVMTFHVRGVTDARERVREARAFLDELVHCVIDKDSSYARILRTEAEYLRRAGDHYLYHEHLEDTNQPCYYSEFAAKAESFGLRYFSEARDGQAENLSPEAAEALDRWSTDAGSRQQYLDFLCNRTFRQALLCPAAANPLDSPSAESVRRLSVRATSRPTSTDPDVLTDAVEEFRIDGGASLSTNHPIVKSALLTLCEQWPRALPYSELARLVFDRLAAREPIEGGAELLPAALLRCFLSGLVGLHIHPPRFEVEPGDLPKGSPVARLQAAGGSPSVASLRHRSITLRAFDRAVLSLLDGRTARHELIDRLVAMVSAGSFEVLRDDGAVRDPEHLRSLFAEEIEPSLRRLAGHALLAENR